MAPRMTSITPSTTTLGLAAEHFVAAALYLLAGAVGLVWIAPELAMGTFAAPRVAGVTHLFTLGWLTTTIFGALCQLLPVALGAPIRSTRVAHVAFWTFAPGAGLFAASIAFSQTMLHHVGIALVSTGVVLAVGNIAATLPKAKSRDVTWAAIAVAITFLASTLVLGVLLLHNLHTGFIATARLTMLAAHLHVAIVGWALVMMVGVSHRLLPMFLLAHGADTRWSLRSLTLLSAGVLALVVGVLTRHPASAWLGVVLLEGGVGCFLWQAYCFHRARVRKKIDIGMIFALTALVFLAASAAMGPFVLADHARNPRLATAYVAVGLLGGIVMFVVGFFYKIVPLLVWTARYRQRMGKEAGALPTVADMYSARIAQLQLGAMTAGVVLLGAGILTGAPHVTRCGTVLFLTGVLLFTSQLVRISFGRHSS